MSSKIGCRAGSTSSADVEPGDPQVGLGQRHLHVAQQVGEERPLAASRPARRRSRRRGPRAARCPARTSRARPSGSGSSRTPTGSPAGRPRSGRPLPGRRDGREPTFSLPSSSTGVAALKNSGSPGRAIRPVCGAGGVADHVHRLVPALQGGVVPARDLVQQRRVQHRGQHDLQVAPGQGGQRVLVGDHLALLGDLHRRVDGAERRARPPPPRTARRRARPSRRGRGTAAAAPRAWPPMSRSCRCARWISHCEVVMPAPLFESE